MKRAFAAILLFIYFTVSTGFVVSLHYCMDRIASIQVGVTNKDKCGKCGMKTSKSDDCCKDEVKVVKLQQDEVNAQYNVAKFFVPQALQPILTFNNVSFIDLFDGHYYFSHGPPLINKQDTYLQNCVFRL